MALHVEIDPRSGFCGGVIRAISKAEEFLETHPGGILYSVGAIVHNEAELERLEAKGLRTVSKESMPAGETLLIRAHGEPPATYAQARGLGCHVIDCTCPVVLQLQGNIREAYARVKPLGGQIVIFGKIGHAEVLGLVGQVDGDALVVEDDAMLEAAIGSEKIDFSKPVEVFSQTTKSPSGYAAICARLRERMERPEDLRVHDTICRQVASRHAQLEDFARTHDVIIFVSGRQSSNGKVLCDLCRGANGRTWQIGSPEELQADWFRDGDRVGVCGATSTPKWLLEDVAQKILQEK